MMTDDTRTTPRTTFRDAYRKAKVDAIDRCRVEMRAGDAVGNAAIERCIAAIDALDVRHAMNARLRDVVREACNV